MSGTPSILLLSFFRSSCSLTHLFIDSCIGGNHHGTPFYPPIAEMRDVDLQYQERRRRKRIVTFVSLQAYFTGNPEREFFDRLGSVKPVKKGFLCLPLCPPLIAHLHAQQHERKSTWTNHKKEKLKKLTLFTFFIVVFFFLTLISLREYVGKYPSVSGHQVQRYSSSYIAFLIEHKDVVFDSYFHVLIGRGQGSMEK